MVLSAKLRNRRLATPCTNYGTVGENMESGVLFVAYDSLSDEAVNQEVVPVPMNLVAPAEEPCIKKLLPESVKGSSLEFDFHGATLRVTDQTSDALLAKVLGVLAHVE